jgi:hypothetical protein
MEAPMAGHSQFKNIMHRKGKQDAMRSKLFGKLAREMTRQHFPPVFESSRVVDSAPPISHMKNASRIEALGRRAFEQLGSWPRVSDVWALLFQTAPSEDHQHAVSRGDVPWDVFDDAVDAILRGAKLPISMNWVYQQQDIPAPVPGEATLPTDDQQGSPPAYQPAAGAA